jgi:hypothetical protein
MLLVVSRRRFLVMGLAGSCGVAASGCGTILYPERIGQPPGMLDWKVVALDTLGLLLFFVPGVISFIVDFYNGTIYLPHGYYGQAAQGSGAAKLVSIDVPRDQLNRARIEQIVSQHVARDVSLVEGQYRTRPLQSIDDFWSQRDALVAENS